MHIILFALLCALSVAAVEKKEADLRFFGKVENRWQPAGKKDDSSRSVFTCESPEKARQFASKRLADLTGFGDIKVVSDSGLPGTVLQLADGGVWLLGTDGDRFYELYSPSLGTLEKFAVACKAKTWEAVKPAIYPKWLDCFDNAGPGMWFGGGGAPVDVPNDLKWFSERGISACQHGTQESQYRGPGLLDTTLSDWFAAEAEKYDFGFRCNLFESKPPWLWNRVPLPYLKGAGYLPSRFDWAAMEAYCVPYGSEPIAASDRYSHDFYRRFYRNLKDNPRFMGSMAIPEIPDADVRILAQFSETPEMKAYWRQYLKEVCGYDLKSVSLAHTGKTGSYARWEDLNIPLPHDFMGFDARTVQLAGEWECRHGETGTWTKVRTDDPMLLLYRTGQSYLKKAEDYYLRRNFVLNGTPRPYLLVAKPDVRGLFCEAWLNGQKLKCTTPEDDRGDLAVCFETGNALKEGSNEIVLKMEGYAPGGFIALNDLPLRPYPLMSKPENKKWYDALNFASWLRMRGVENILRAIRSVEPDRPLKMMALIKHLDQSVDLCEKYGAYQHDTGGAAAYFCTFTGARLSRTHGLPWSCEQGGPPDNAQDFKGNITYYLLYGNDAADLVFATTHYKDKPDIAAWFDENLELIKCIGKMRLPRQNTGILKSTRTLRLGFNEPMWNDISRGLLQKSGRTFSYLETADLSNGIADKYPVIFDCATVMMSADEIEAVRKYAENGGVFIAQYCTGRHSPDEGNSWAFAKAFGFSTEPKYMSDANYNRWPMAPITIADGQRMFPSLTGKPCKGCGVVYTPIGKLPETVTPVMTWKDGGIAVAEIKVGKGKVILLGTAIERRFMDDKGWVRALDVLLDELLVYAGSPRESRAGDLWAECWRSKNGVYDLYPVANLTKETQTASVQLKCPVEPAILRETGALGHPRRTAEWKDGWLTIPSAEYTPMQTRIFTAPRADVARSSLEWFTSLSEIWRAIEKVPPSSETVEIPSDIISLADDWRVSTELKSETWPQPAFDDRAWRKVRLGTFVAAGIPEKSVAGFRRTIQVPEGWKGKQVLLNFEGAYWFYGIVPEGRLWINGEPAALKQPLRAYGESSYLVDVTEAAKTGQIVFALEVDGTKFTEGKPQNRPVGVTGLFWLSAVEPVVAQSVLSGPWFAAKDVNVLEAVPEGAKAEYVYLQTKFAVGPRKAKRLFLEADVKLRYLMLNGRMVNVPMNSLDVTGLVDFSGKNVLRWMPESNGQPDILKLRKGTVPELRLVWRN